MDWQQLIEHRPRLMQRALRLTNNSADAKDLVQDTLLRAWIYRDRCRSNLLGWMLRIMANRAADNRRSARRVVYSEELPDGLPEPTISSSAEPYCALASVVAAMGGINPKFVDAFALNRIDGLPYMEVAQQLGIPIGTVRSRIARAQEELERAL